MLGFRTGYRNGAALVHHAAKLSCGGGCHFWCRGVILCVALSTSHLPRSDSMLRVSRPLLQVHASLSFIQWAQSGSGWLAWTCDAIDFVSVSLSVIRLSEQFGKDTRLIMTSVSLTLLFRSVGAVLFGVFSDQIYELLPLNTSFAGWSHISEEDGSAQEPSSTTPTCRTLAPID